MRLKVAGKLLLDDKMPQLEDEIGEERIDKSHEGITFGEFLPNVFSIGVPVVCALVTNEPNELGD